MKKKKWKDLDFPKLIDLYSFPDHFQIYIESHAKIRKYNTYKSKREAYLNPPETFLWRLLAFKLSYASGYPPYPTENHLLIEKYFDSEKDLRLYLHTLESNWDSIKMLIAEFPEWTFVDGSMCTSIDQNIYKVCVSDTMRFYTVYKAVTDQDWKKLFDIKSNGQNDLAVLKNMWNNIKESFPNILMEEAL